MPHPDSLQIAERLRQTTFLDLFQRLDRKLLDSLWDGGRASAALQAVVLNPSFDSRARFLAAEILFTMNPAWPPPTACASVTRVYVAALRDAPGEMANPWGLPGMSDGLIASHVLRLGEAAIPALLPLLDDETPVQFSGSKDAAYGNSFAWRVKDIAASLIARMRPLSFSPDPDPAVRDRAIAALKASLQSVQ
ncbi:MAG TPA: hypothetical protein VMU71_11095 [Terracidiphilus sp.]|nr:hypothetical protein [Terracidiphilus sp.]